MLPSGCPAVIGEAYRYDKKCRVWRPEETPENLSGRIEEIQEQRVRITIDGVECPEKEWEKIFEMGEDGGFYMGDYVGAEQGCLKEIRFDKVYLSDPPKEKKDEDS